MGDLDFSSPGGVKENLINAKFKINGHKIASAALKAVNRMNSSDVLTSPRVTTMNGTTALVNMIEGRYYPDDYTRTRIVSHNNKDYIVQPVPRFSSATDVGVVFEVTPYIEPDRYTISLELRPNIKQFITFDEFPVTARIRGKTYTYTKKVPVFSVRSISTKVSIHDGETIMIGGIISDQTEVIEEKVPLLGDVPFIGRFFRGQRVSSKKTNMLIFLTCRIIDPDGSPVRESIRNGKPPLYH